MHWSPFGVRRPVSQFPHRTPGIRQSLINVPASFQLCEIKEANQLAILNALNHPDANITKLLEETEAKYSGIYFLLPPSSTDSFHIFQEICRSMLISFNIHFPAQGVTDHEEPDLAAYAAIDMSTLRDVRRMGINYILSMEALMHTMPGLKPGYLPERYAHYLLSGVSIFGHQCCWQSLLFKLPSCSVFEFIELFSSSRP